MRRLRGKHLRHLLWVAAGGRCQLCDVPLLESWHADHVTPYSVSGRTNVNEMQALCPKCNLRKGASMFRMHQKELDELAQQIAAGTIRMPEWLFAHIVPGGGKSSLPVILAYWLIRKAKLADKICWVVPNGSLRTQAVGAFGKGRWEARYYGHDLQIVSNVNEANPSKGSVGYVTTYQALRADAYGLHRQEFQRYRYILVLDEFHHCAHGLPYHAAVEPLVELSLLTLCMTGTVDRADRRAIYPLPYCNRMVDKKPAPGTHWIGYDIRQGTLEKAIIKVFFEHSDAASRWYDPNLKKECEAETLGDNRQALFAALKTDYARQLLDDCVEAWQRYRQSQRRSKMLVVCGDTNQAADMASRLKGKHGIIDSQIATYREDEPEEAIRCFREEDKPSVLVTVAMAYEGLDVPSITHLACLTHIRSRPWIEQMFARGWRYDPQAGPWESQGFYAFVPDDVEMRSCVKAIEEGQAEPVREMWPKKDQESEKTGGASYPKDIHPQDITPIASAVTDRWNSELNGERMSAEETEVYRSLVAKHGLSLSPLQAKQFFEDAKTRLDAGVGSAQQEREVPDAPLEQRLRIFRRQLGERVRLASKGDGEACKQINSALKVRFGPREAMTEEQLRAALSWIHECWGR
jgi:superfamily II DNA or RNA helicase